MGSRILAHGIKVVLVHHAGADMVVEMAASIEEGAWGSGLLTWQQLEKIIRTQEQALPLKAWR